MSSMTFGQKIFKPTPPDKGSFPLDHDGICKSSMSKYMKCLVKENNNNSKCRLEAKGMRELLSLSYLLYLFFRIFGLPYET